MREEQQQDAYDLLRADVTSHVRHVYGERGTYDGTYALFTRQASDGKFYSSLMFHTPLTRDGKLYPWRQGQWEYEALHYAWPDGHALGAHLELAIERILGKLGFTREFVPPADEVTREYDGAEPALPTNVLRFKLPEKNLERRVA